MGLGVWFLVRKFKSPAFYAAVAVLTVAMAIVLTVNVVKFKQVPSYKELGTHVSPGEIEAAQFLRQNYEGKAVLLVSEPATMQILEGLSGINTPGGAYAKKATREILAQTYYSRDSHLISAELTQVSDTLITQKPDVYLLAISGRYEKWQSANEERKMGIHWNVWTPYDLSATALENDEFIDFMISVDGVKEVFRNESMVILEIPQTPAYN